jgi:hypothetical protein
MPIRLDRLLSTDASSFVKHEVPTPAPNGVVTVFTTADEYETGSLEVFRDQSALQGGVDFTETTSTTFTLAIAPDTDEVIWVNYIKK